MRTQQINQDWVAIHIQDNGMGMTEEVASKIFDPFFTTKPIGKGTGLGMTVCYQIIVEKHCGRISCNSILGTHTEFIIQIPLKQPKNEL
ncbi:sensor histidine kinase [Brunnivagina elsteri]|uniref:sensor histidine kinase n=1 Tax=Brunnivagina elsteri TaxID=1247191 RepID=UPI003183FC56